MDSTVITLDQVETILPHITFSIPTPIVILGINNSDFWFGVEINGLFGNKKLALLKVQKEVLLGRVNRRRT